MLDFIGVLEKNGFVVSKSSMLEKWFLGNDHDYSVMTIGRVGLKLGKWHEKNPH